VSLASASNPAHWAFRQVGTHSAVDTVNAVSTATATNLASLIALCNSLKAALNKHEFEPNVHHSDDSSNLVRSAAATNAGTAAVLLDELETRYLAHAAAEPMHSASDPVNLFPYAKPSAADIPGCCAIANALKAAFNGHLAAEYPLPLASVDYVGPISPAFAQNGSSPVVDAATWHVDVMVTSASPRASIRVFATVSSEDPGDTTSPLNHTGNFVARPAFGPAVVVGSSVSADYGVSVKSDRELSLQFSGRPPLGAPLPICRFTSVHAAAWALAELWAVYDRHRTVQPHHLPDGSVVVDTANYMTSYDAPAPPVGPLCASALAFLSRFAAHRVASYHVHDDPFPLDLGMGATDAASFVRLVEVLCAAFDAHTENPGLHGGPPVRWRSAPLFDSALMGTGVQLNGADGVADFPLSSVSRDLRGGGDAVFPSVLSAGFRGVSAEPAVAAAVPRSGVLKYGAGMVSDEVQVFFSKPMAQGDLSPVTISGGVVTKSRAWSTPTKAVIVVSNMDVASYDLDAAGLPDVAGNQVQ
jgi:hypothetical protein